MSLVVIFNKLTDKLHSFTSFSALTLSFLYCELMERFEFISWLWLHLVLSNVVFHKRFTLTLIELSPSTWFCHFPYGEFVFTITFCIIWLHVDWSLCRYLHVRWVLVISSVTHLLEACPLVLRTQLSVHQLVLLTSSLPSSYLIERIIGTSTRSYAFIRTSNRAISMFIVIISDTSKSESQTSHSLLLPHHRMSAPIY